MLSDGDALISSPRRTLSFSAAGSSDDFYHRHDPGSTSELSPILPASPLEAQFLVVLFTSKLIEGKPTQS